MAKEQILIRLDFVYINVRPFVYPAILLDRSALTRGATVIDQVTATAFHRFMDYGRTSPAIFSCEGGETSGGSEYVVKLRGGLELRERGLVYELYASMLGAFLGMSCPRPAIVLIDEDLTGVVLEELSGDERKAQIIRDSVGLNFGTEFLVNITGWPVDKPVPLPMQAAAIKVYAFDALIQNPDRTFNNPNLGSRNDDLFIFDHEEAFSFLLSIFPSRTPWKLDTEVYLERHVFARALNQVPFPVDFLQRLSNLSEKVTAYFSEQIPSVWKSDDLPKIESHLALMSEHAAEFADEVTRRLA